MSKIHPGDVFGKLTVLKDSLERDSSKHVLWLCQCQCGNIVKIRSSNLTNGNSKSCGCTKKRHNLLNQKFGLLTVIQDMGNDSYGNSIWKCQCECGNVKIIRGGNLINKNTISCGCKKFSKGELIIKNILDQNNINYINEYQPVELQGKRFDFAILNENNLVQRLIEFDGIQHFQSWYQEDKDSLEERQKRDQLKNNWAKNKNIPLVRIPYWELENINKEMLFSDKYLI